MGRGTAAHDGVTTAIHVLTLALYMKAACHVAFRSLGSDRHPTRARERLCAQHLTTDGTCIIQNIGTSSRGHWPRRTAIGQRRISWCLIARILSETHGHAALPPPTSNSRRHISYLLLLLHKVLSWTQISCTLLTFTLAQSSATQAMFVMSAAVSIPVCRCR